MIADLKPYPTMKDSGVPWLGPVPEHWAVLPNRAVFDEVKERNRPDADMLSVTIAKGVIRQKALLEDSSKKDSSKLDKSAYKLVRPNDIAYNKMRAWQGAVGVSNYEGIVSPAYVVQRPREGSLPHYLHYLLRTPAFAKEAERWSYGITSDMWSLRPEHFKLIYSCLPPLPEQDAIVRFLEYVDRRIRRYVRAKQKLIKLLEEQKQAIIHRAVTRGLDPNVRLKPSGVEWLGDVPEHWEVVPLKRAFSRMDYGISDSGSESGVIPVLTMGHIRNGMVTVPKLGGVDRVEPDLLLRDRDLLFNRTNSTELVAKVGLFRSVDRPVTFASYLVRLRSHAAHSPEFLNLVLNAPAFLGAARREAIPSLHQSNLNPTRYGRLPIPLPPPQEQRDIAEAVLERTSDLNNTAASARQEIDFLGEYRTRLISDVVTGKLDVREAAARLPDEADEPEPLEETEDMIDAEDGTADDLEATVEEDGA